MNERSVSGDRMIPAPGDVWEGDGSARGFSRDVAVEDGHRSGLTHYVMILRKRKWLIVSTTAIALLIGLVATLLAEPVYTARATFEVQREAPRVLDVNSVEADNNGDALFFQTQFALIKSRASAQGIVRRLKLDSNPEFVDVSGGLFDAKTGSAATPQERQRAFEAATNKVQAGLLAAPYAGSSLIEVTYESNDPRMAAAVANAAVDEFIESTIDRQYAASNYARNFLGRRLQELKQRLGASERELVNYAAQQGIVNVTDARNAGQSQSLDSASLSALNASLAQATAARVQAEQNWRLAQQASGRTLPQVLADPQVSALTGQLAALRSDYEQRLQTFKPEFPAMVQARAKITETEGELAAARNRVLQSLRGSYELALNQEQALQKQMEQSTGKVIDLQGRSIQYTILQREVDTNRALYDALLQRYKEIGVSGGAGSNSVSVIDRARVPGSPSRPILWLNLALAFLAGLGLGVAISLILEFVDDTFKLPEDVENKLHLPLLGMIPKLEEDQVAVDELADPRSGFSEAYFAVRTALQISGPNGLPRSLLVTSSNPAEGKSTTAVALAYSFAGGGKRVLLIDADMRRPNLHKLLSTTNVRGLSTVLSGEASMRDAVQTIEAGFDVVPAGPIPPNPARLLSTGLRPLLAEAMANYDLVLVDGPPVVGLADVPMLSAAIEATVLVVQAKKSRRGVVLSALRRLRGSRGQIAGVVLTKFDRKAAAYSDSLDYSEYYYSYGEKTAG